MDGGRNETFARIFLTVDKDIFGLPIQQDVTLIQHNNASSVLGDQVHIVGNHRYRCIVLIDQPLGEASSDC